MNELFPKATLLGAAKDREMLKDATTRVYAQRPEGDLEAHLFFPEKPSSGLRAVVIFFHGGFWESSMPGQFVPHGLHFASRGAVAICAETRVSSKHGTGAMEAIDDARELILWVRQHAEELQIDPQRVIVGGSAGGASLALMTAMPKEKFLPTAGGFDCCPQALLLFSALVELKNHAQASARFPDAKSAKQSSPLRMARRKLPPMLFFHGKVDRIAPFAAVQAFQRKLRWRGNRCELVDFEKEDHSFFNFHVSHGHFERTVRAADHFLVELGLLDPEEEHEAAE